MQMKTDILYLLQEYLKSLNYVAKGYTVSVKILDLISRCNNLCEKRNVDMFIGL
jgi:hypothetical protein